MHARRMTHLCQGVYQPTISRSNKTRGNLARGCCLSWVLSWVVLAKYQCMVSGVHAGFTLGSRSVNQKDGVPQVRSTRSFGENSVGFLAFAKTITRGHLVA